MNKVILSAAIILGVGLSYCHTSHNSSSSTKNNLSNQLGTNEDCWQNDTTYYSVKDTFPEYDTTKYPDVIPDTTLNSEDVYDEDYKNISKEGYKFNITSNGWYNIDAFLKTEPDKIENVSLIADLKMTEDAFMNVYVFIPSERVLQVTHNKKGNQYYFDYENQTIPLPLRYRAVIFAFGSYKNKILYGVTEFTINKQQIIPVEIKETTGEGLKNILFSKNINGIELDAIEKKMEINKIPCSDTGRIQNTATASADSTK